MGESDPQRWDPESFLTPQIFQPKGADAGVGTFSGKQLLAIKEWSTQLATALAPGTHAAPSLGDQVLRSPSRALEIVHEGTVDLRREVRGNIGRAGRGGAVLRAAYGIPDRRGLPDTRTIICLAADVAFAEFAAGYWEVTRAARTTLRIDLRSACNMVWNWGNIEHRALAMALRQALTFSPGGGPVAFGPIADLYERTFRLHAGTPGSAEQRGTALSQFTLARFDAGGPARPSERYLFAPLMEHLRAAEDPEVRLELRQPPLSNRQQLAEAVLPLFRELRDAGSVEQATTLLDDVKAAIELSEHR